MKAKDIDQFKQGGRYMPGGRIQYDTPDLTSALELASTFYKNGTYKYFRGQADARWEVTSTFSRLDEAGRKRAVNEFSKFYGFAKSSPELLPYLQTDDALIATAQHHGLAATTFIDFSTSPEVAGWFASDGAEIGTMGAIFMVDEAAEDTFRHFSKPGQLIRFLTLDVPNLWRLQAQQGLFLETQVDIVQIWPLDRIVFPHGASPSPIERRHIYPDRKSALELAIDQYQLQRTRKETFDTFMQGIDTSKIAFIEVSDDDDDVPEFSPQVPSDWSSGPDERWQDIDPDSPPPPMTVEQLSASSHALRDLITERRRCTDLLRLSDPGSETLQLHLDHLWAGCRPHPYRADQLARAIAGLVSTHKVLKGRSLSSGQDLRAAAAELYETPVEIAMSAAGENATRAFVDARRLWSALKPEARERLGLESEPSPTRLQAQLQRDFRRPWRNFDEQQLIDLFADQIIPWQLVSGRNPVAFSAFHMLTIGRP